MSTHAAVLLCLTVSFGSPAGQGNDVNSASFAQRGEVPEALLQELGLAGMQRVPAIEGLQIRGKGFLENVPGNQPLTGPVSGQPLQNPLGLQPTPFDSPLGLPPLPVDGLANGSQQSGTGLPGLSRLPFVSRLFRNVGATGSEQSLLLLVTPRIILQ